MPKDFDPSRLVQKSCDVTPCVSPIVDETQSTEQNEYQSLTPPLQEETQQIVTKKSIRICEEQQLPSLDDIKAPSSTMETGTLTGTVLPNEECTFTVTLKNGGTLVNQPVYSVACDDLLFNMSHYLSPIKSGDTTFDINFKNMINQTRNITVKFWVEF